jgi:hypothetical protein
MMIRSPSEVPYLHPGEFQVLSPSSPLHGKDESAYADYLERTMRVCGVEYRREVWGQYIWLPHFRTCDVGARCRIDFVVRYGDAVFGIECKAPSERKRMNDAIHQAMDYVSFAKWEWPTENTYLDCVVIAPAHFNGGFLASLCSQHRIGSLHHRPKTHKVCCCIGHCHFCEWDAAPIDWNTKKRMPPYFKWRHDITTGKKSGSR